MERAFQEDTDQVLGCTGSRYVIFSLGFPGGSMGIEPTCSAGDTGDMGSIPRSGRSTEGGHDNPLQYPCMDNAMGRGAWWAIVHRLQRVGHDQSD